MSKLRLFLNSASKIILGIVILVGVADAIAMEDKEATFHYLILHNKEEKAQEFLAKYGDEMDLNRLYGTLQQTVLHMAVRMGYTNLPVMLLIKGVLPNQIDSEGNTAYDLATKRETSGGPGDGFFGYYYPAFVIRLRGMGCLSASEIKVPDEGPRIGLVRVSSDDFYSVPTGHPDDVAKRAAKRLREIAKSSSNSPVKEQNSGVWRTYFGRIGAVAIMGILAKILYDNKVAIESAVNNLFGHPEQKKTSGR